MQKIEVKLAKNYGFCFGVRRAIEIAQSRPNSVVLGELIHNPKEIARLERDFGVGVCEDIEKIDPAKAVIIRTHGIQKNDLSKLKERGADITDATCPFVIKPQEICAKCSREGYEIIIFGDAAHPEIKGVVSYCENSTPLVINSLESLKAAKEQNKIKSKVALISQTTKSAEVFGQIAEFLSGICSEVRVFNTICNATFDNQQSARSLAKEVEIMIIVGGKNSSNTKMLYKISSEFCENCYLIEDENELNVEWFVGKKSCGITAGASTPEWIIEKVLKRIKEF